MRVLHVISGLDPRHGGTTSALLALMRAQRDAGMQVGLVSTFCDWDLPDTADLIRREGFDLHLIGPATRRLAWSRQIKPTLKQLIPQFDLIHIHAIWEEIQHRAAVLSRRMNKAHIITPHGMLDPWSLSQSRGMKRIYFALRLRRDLNHASAMHFTDELERQSVSPLNLICPTFVQPLVVDLGDFTPAPARGFLRERYPQLRDRPIVLFMSRIHPKKGLDLLIPAFAAGAPADAMLVIAGPDRDGYQSSVQEMIDRHKIADRVIFTGMLTGRDRAAAMADSDLFVLPSYQENFGVVVIEALSVGLPAILSDKVNIHQQITDHQLGEVIPTQVSRLTEALRGWMGDPQRRAHTSDRARQYIATHFDRLTLARQWIAHYERLIQRKSV